MARLAAFLDGLQQLGWTDGRNVQIDTRWARDVGTNRGAEELVALGPDVILASASRSVAALQGITRSVPIVFANVVDPVGAGFVASLARPGRNTTGFSAFEYSLSGKWLELLPNVSASHADTAGRGRALARSRSGSPPTRCAGSPPCLDRLRSRIGS